MALRTESMCQETLNIGSQEPRYKRPFDLIILVLAHVLVAPLWLALWIAIPLAIKLDDGGPIFYSQTRIGRNGKQFTVRKFRSMVTDAEKGTGAVWASRNDPRITRIGRILRHTALDELPQVLNVWVGDMSLVGPRPERPELHAKIAANTPGFDKRLMMRPGMAGMAQVYGKYDLSPPDKLVFDLRYSRSMGIRTDLKLLTLSVFNTLLGRWGHPTGNTAVPSATAEPIEQSVPSNVVPFTPAANASDVVEKDDAADELDPAA